MPILINHVIRENPMEPLAAASTTGRIAYFTYTKRQLIQEYWKKLWVWVGKCQTNVLVLGAAGAGTSVLVASWNGEANKSEWQPPGPSSSAETSPITIGDWTKVVRVLPGQMSEQRELGLAEAFQVHQELEGIIYVVDWGYTTIRDNAAKLLLQNNGLTTIEAIRKRHLADELTEFRRVLSHIRTSFATKKRPKWLAIALNKVDLYSNRLAEAELYYHPDGDSEFAKETQITSQQEVRGYLKQFIERLSILVSRIK
jgi:hypothetical protein